MTRRQVLLSGGGMACKTMPLRIRDTHYGPFSVPILERVLHGHSVDYAWIAFGVESHSSVSKIPIEGDRSGCHIQAFEIEAGACLEAMQNRSLYLFFFILITGAATRKYYEGYKKSRRGT
jgi:hypothetical protein